MKRLTTIVLLMLFSTLLFANVDETIGNIRIVIEDYSGSVSLYRQTSDDTFKSFFDSKTFTKTPSFFVLYDGVVLPVSVQSGFNITSEVVNNQVIFSATLKNKLNVTVYYDFFSTVEGAVSDSVKVSATIENLSPESHDVALKAFFDTWLGESTATHFTTSLRPAITSETLFTDIKNDKWIQSANLTNAIRFIIPESRIDDINSIVVANKNLLSQQVWNFNVTQGREFHSLNSYNNSALAITWNNFILGTDIYDKAEFYIFTSEATSIMPTQWPPAAASSVMVEEPVEIPSVENMQALSDSLSSLSPEDLQEILRILDTINALSEDNSYLNQDEIILLNSQVDAILERAGR